MSEVLIFASVNDKGVLHHSIASLAAQAAARGFAAVLAVPTTNADLLTALGAAGVSQAYAPENADAIGLRQQALLIKQVAEKEGAKEIWFYRNKDLAAYVGGLLSAPVVEHVKERTAENTLTTEFFSGKYLRKEKMPSHPICIISYATLPESKNHQSVSCSVQTLSTEKGVAEKIGEPIVQEKQEAIPLTSAQVVLTAGDGIGSKGIPAIKKLASVMRALGVKVAVGGSRVVTDGGRLPHEAQIGVSGVTVTPDLIFSIGVSGAPQHLVGMLNSKYKVCVNTDADAPLMQLCDFPILGDGNTFLKDMTEALIESMTPEQKESLSKPAQPKKTVDAPEAGEFLAGSASHENLKDLPLNVDMRSIFFEAFEVYKIQELSPNWTIEKMKGLVERIAKFSEKLVNQGKRNAEQRGIIFRPGEEYKEKAVLAPPYYHKAWAEYYKGGFGKLATPKSLGGLELPHGMIDYIIEIASAGSPALGTYFGLTQGSALIVSTFGNDWMKEYVLPGLMDGRFQGTMCLTEAQAGSDLAAVTCTATRVEKSEVFELSGTKVFITSGDHDITENHWHIVLAKIPGTGLEGTRAISLFLVPKFWVDDECVIQGFNDVETQSIEHKSGLMTSPTCVLKFNKSKGFLIANSIEEEIRSPSGMKKMFFFMNAMRHETGTAGRGQAVATCLDALVYSNDRKQGVAIKDMGTKVQQSAIIYHGNQKKLLLDMFARTFGDRALTQKLTEIRDRAHFAFHVGMEEIKKAQVALSMEESQKKELDALVAKINKFDKQIAKSREALSRLRKDPAGVERIQKEKEELTNSRNALKAQVEATSPRYWELQEKKRKLKKANDDAEIYASIFTSLVKAQVTDDNVRTLIDGMQAYGGIGFMAETPVAQRLHDSQILCIWEGTNDIQALNTVFRQIGNDVKNSRGEVIFLKVMSEINSTLEKYQWDKHFGSNVQLLQRYIKELIAFRNAMTVSTWRDMLKFASKTYGFKLKPTKEETIKAKMLWGESMQAVARSFNTYFAHAVQAWQLLRIGVLAAKKLDEKKKGYANNFDYDTYDEKFLQGRILIAKHFISSPGCMDKNLFCWREFFFDNVAIQMEYEHLADKPNRISMA